MNPGLVEPLTQIGRFGNRQRHRPEIIDDHEAFLRRGGAGFDQLGQVGELVGRRRLDVDRALDEVVEPALDLRA